MCWSFWMKRIATTCSIRDIRDPLNEFVVEQMFWCCELSPKYTDWPGCALDTESGQRRFCGKWTRCGRHLIHRELLRLQRLRRWATANIRDGRLNRIGRECSS